MHNTRKILVVLSATAVKARSVQFLGMWTSLEWSPTSDVGERRFKSGHPDQFLRMWRSLVAYLLGKQEAAGSSTVILTSLSRCSLIGLKPVPWKHEDVGSNPTA